MTIPRHTRPRRTRPRPVNPERRKREFTRCFHSKARVAFVKSLPCAVPGCNSRQIENAHVGRGSGMGRRGDYFEVVPLCAQHHTNGNDSHHALGSTALFDARHGTDLLTAAARTEEAWRKHCER